MAQEADTPDPDPVATARESSPGQERFLSRWSRRKQAARGVQDNGDDAASSTATLQPESAQAIGHEAPELTDQDMPALESLDESSDYSGFLSPKVSDELRQLALRKLFHLPQFNVTDGLDDYAEDYTAFKGLGGIVTHEMRRLLEQEKARALAAEGGGENGLSSQPGDMSTARVAPDSLDTPAPEAADEDASDDPTEESV